jgi:N-acetylglucosaminyldiphosphoundecaprenol N-acetyl-beta-D-mannosaminyltransferase
MPSESAIELMGIRLDNLHRDEISASVVAAARGGQRLLVLNANAQMMVLAQKHAWLPAFFRRADIAFCDGAGVQLAARFLRGHGLHRTTPPEWIGGVMTALGSNAKVFWIGGKPEIAAAAARQFELRYGVQTAGIQHGFFDAAKDSKATRELVARINQAAPTILLVNMGMPRQERWLMENYGDLPPCVAITAGALVDHAAGIVRRPPRWVANLGIEWLVRLAREPRRLWRRYLLGLPVFAVYILRFALAGRS